MSKRAAPEPTSPFSFTVFSEAPPHLVGRFDLVLNDEGACLTCKPVKAEVVADKNGLPCDLRVRYEWVGKRGSHPTVDTFKRAIYKCKWLLDEDLLEEILILQKVTSSQRPVMQLFIGVKVVF